MRLSFEPDFATPRSASFVHAECRRLWNRQVTPADAFADSHASFRLTLVEGLPD